MSGIRTLRSMALVGLVTAGLACDDATGPVDSTAGELGVVLNSVDRSLTLFSVDSPSVTRTVGLGPDGSPTTLALRGPVAAVPLGLFPALALVDLENGAVETVPLPQGSGATGVAFANDSIVYVANPNLNTVTVVNARRDSAIAEIAVGTYPSSVIAGADRIFVLEAQLDSLFQPARNGRLTVIDPASRTVVDSVTLGGLNPIAAEFAADGMLYVLHAGTFGGGNGSLSVVDPAVPAEIEHHEGFGEFPGHIAIDVYNVHVSAFAFGVAVWDAAGDSFIYTPDDPLPLPAGLPDAVSAVGFDSGGRTYTLVPDCTQPARVVRLGADASIDAEVTVGTCPIDIGFTVP